ncbi:hypothetical protein K9M59_01825 [Candidatus Gracilibacteria bacterium]|nr:hypothetical protein [Candidatus Gracilibacteria bacterium]
MNKQQILVTGGAGFIGSNQRLFCGEERTGKQVVPHLMRDPFIYDKKGKKYL